VSVACGTLGLPDGCSISRISWFAHRASCLYVFGGSWRVSECDIRTDHPAGDAIYCRGTSRVPLPDRMINNVYADSQAGRHRFLKFPRVQLTVESCGLGGLRSGVPAGWGVCVTEKARFSIVDSRIEWVHQALAVVDMVRAKVTGCTMSHTGNALWFGNKCDVSLTGCTIDDTICAFSLRTMWDRGTKCGDAAQDEDDGQAARLQLRDCEVQAMSFFEGNRRPGYFVNQTSTFGVPSTAVNASAVRPPLPYIKDPYSYHLRNLHRTDLSHIKTFGADRQLVRPNPAYRPDGTTGFPSIDPHREAEADQNDLLHSQAQFSRER
jgi:hypothetical protein